MEYLQEGNMKVAVSIVLSAAEREEVEKLARGRRVAEEVTEVSRKGEA